MKAIPTINAMNYFDTNLSEIILHLEKLADRCDHSCFEQSEDPNDWCQYCLIENCINQLHMRTISMIREHKWDPLFIIKGSTAFDI